jgi:hypothetical protein
LTGADPGTWALVAGAKRDPGNNNGALERLQEYIFNPNVGNPNIAVPLYKGIRLAARHRKKAS